MSALNHRLLALAAAGAMTAAVLAGCSAPSAATHGGSGGSSGGSDSSNSAAPSDSPSDGTTGSGDGSDPNTYSIPATFPKAVPIIEGDVVYSADLGTGWLLWLAHDDFNSGYTDAVSKLKDAGFTGDTAAQTDQGSVGQFSNDKFQVTVTAGDDPTYGKAVSYTVVKLG